MQNSVYRPKPNQAIAWKHEEIVHCTQRFRIHTINIKGKPYDSKNKLQEIMAILYIIRKSLNNLTMNGNQQLGSHL